MNNAKILENSDPCLVISEASSSKTAFFSFTLLSNNSLVRNYINGKSKYVLDGEKIDVYAQSNNTQAYHKVLFNNIIIDHIFNVNCSNFYWGLLASGGMRDNVDASIQKKFYNDIGKLFELNDQNICKDGVCKQISLKKAETIEGQDEGYYAWLTIKQEHEPEGKHISLDLGGATMQFSEGTKESSISWSLGKQATIINLENDVQPCYNDQNNELSGIKYNGTLCRSIIDSYLNNYLSNSSSAFPDVSKIQYSKFYTISNFYNYFNDVCDTYLPYIKDNKLPIDPDILKQTQHICDSRKQTDSPIVLGINDYQTITDAVCIYWGTDWNVNSKTYLFARDACFSGNYNYEILKNFGLKDGNPVYVDRADWDLGAATDMLNTCIDSNDPTLCYPYESMHWSFDAESFGLGMIPGAILGVVTMAAYSWAQNSHPSGESQPLFA